MRRGGRGLAACAQGKGQITTQCQKRNSVRHMARDGITGGSADSRGLTDLL
jgi:hypothetical protein